MSMQAVELLYAKRPDFDAEAIAARVAEITGEETDGLSGDASTMIMHKAFVVEYEDGAAPAQTVILRSSDAPEPAHYESELQQSHGTENAAALVEGASDVVMLMEMMARGLHPPNRIEAFHATLQAVIERTQPQALAFKHTQQIIDPLAYLSALDAPPIGRPGSLNVRMFGTGDEDVLMDTRGMDEIGLHDLQCHFKGLPPNAVAGTLYNLAYYIFENGPVIESGHTVQGTEEGSSWVCQFEHSLVDEDREVLDLNPGPPHAAGNRE